MKGYTNLSSQTNLERCLAENFGWNLEVILLSILLPPKHYFVSETPHYDDDDTDCVFVLIFQSLGYFSPLPQPSHSQWLKESPSFFLAPRVRTASLAQNTIGFLQRDKSFQTAWGLESLWNQMEICSFHMLMQMTLTLLWTQKVEYQAHWDAEHVTVVNPS